MKLRLCFVLGALLAGANLNAAMSVTFDSPAKDWQQSLLTGNGTIGAMVRGNVELETISLSHCKLYLPESGTNTPTISTRAKPKPGDYTSRDGFMAACDLKIATRIVDIRNYRRETNYETGECIVNCDSKHGPYRRRVAAIRGENVIAIKIDNLRNAVFSLHAIAPASRDDVTAYANGIRKIEESPDYYRCEFKNSNPWNDLVGYEVLLLTKELEKGREAFVVIEPLRKGETSNRERMSERLNAAAAKGYDRLVAENSVYLTEMMNRVSFELEGPDDARAMVRSFNSGRYNIISSTGGDHIPNLQGLWAGTWAAPWKASFTVNGNLPCAISFFSRGATPELNECLLKWIEARLPAMREGARLNFNARGWRTAAQTTIAGVETDFNPAYPHVYWHGGAAWLLSRLYDGYRHTLDKEWLARIYPLMKEIAEYYEDVLVEMADGTLGFNPSYSPENWPKGKRPTAVNATMDIGISKQFLDEYIRASEILGRDEAFRAKVRILRARLTPYRVSDQGYFAEWLTPNQADNNEHRHASHLYPLYDDAPAEIVTNAALVASIQKTIDARMDFNENRSRTMAFGYVQNGLAACKIGDAARAARCLALLTKKNWVEGGGSTHDWHNIFNTDISGGYPYLISEMLVHSEEGYIRFLPAKPKDWRKGVITGLLLRGGIRLERLSWTNDAWEAVLKMPDGLVRHVSGKGDTKWTIPTATPYWEDVTVSRVNTLEPRDELVPFETEAAAKAWANLMAERETSPYVLSLTGTWNFVWKARPDASEGKSAKVAVPGCWQLQGDFDPPLYTNYNYPHVNDPPHIMVAPPKDFTQYVYRNPVGIYRRSFIVPTAWKNRRIVLRFNGVASAFFVRINGENVGYAEDSRLPSEFDVTDFLVSEGGENSLEVEVYRWSDGSYLEDQDFWRLSGIYRDVWLQAEGRETPHDVRGTVQMARPKDVKPWSPENPTLYTRTWRAPNGDWYAWCEGYRNIAISNAVVYVNGERLFVKGVNRHEISPTGGYAMTHAEMERDVKLIKEYGFNAVRTCHYPNDSYWYRLCDKYGLLLVCEANVECHGSGQGNQSRSCARRPDWRHVFVERGVNMVKTYRHHPSIYFWSLGNECWDGPNLQAEYDAMKSLDSTRPIQYSCSAKMRYSDIAAPMYWTIEKCRSYIENAPPKPLIQCEYAHAMGNAGGTLKAHLMLAQKNEHYQGGFIWDFADQALLGKDGHLKYGGDFGDRPNDGNFCCNGVFDAFRHPHGSAIEARALFGGIMKTDSFVDRSQRPIGAGNGALLESISFKPNFWRAPTDNDRGWKIDQECGVWKQVSESGKIPANCKSALEVQKVDDSTCRVTYRFEPSAELPDLPRVGLTFTLPGSRQTFVRWLGRGPWENYADRTAGTSVGGWAMKVEELNPNNYVSPGEQGYRTETTHLEIGDYAIEAEPGTSFGFNVWPWTQQSLEAAKHIEELVEADFLTVNIDVAQMGIGGDDSWSTAAKPLSQFRLSSGRVYELSFTVKKIR